MTVPWSSRARLLLGAVVAALAIMAVGAAGAQAKLVKVTGSTTVIAIQRSEDFPGQRRCFGGSRCSRQARPTGFTFPIFTGFGDTKTYNGLLAHKRRPEVLKGEKSAGGPALRGRPHRQAVRAAGPAPRVRVAARACAPPFVTSRSSTGRAYTDPLSKAKPVSEGREGLHQATKRSTAARVA